MKKLFSYLLISSMVIVSSCTNYDDQFDDLNAQITSLKSQIEGFSSLSTGLTSLQGTVSALQSAVNALPKTATPATDVSGLEASVAALQAQLANAATSAEVAAITADLAATQTALEAVIAQNATDLTDLEAAVAALENTDISDLETAVAALQTALDSAATSAEITALQTAIDALENTDLTDVSASLSELQTALALLENTDVSGIEDSVATLNTLVTATQASIAANATSIADNATSIEAVTAALSELADTIAELKAKLATVSTAEEVADLAADLAATQADLDILLAQSSFYSGSLSITSQAELDFANSLGNKLNVVQGDVTITQNEDMNVTTLTAVMSRFVTVTGDVAYSETVSTTTKTTFANLIGTASMTINHAGDISLPKLVSVTGNLSITGNDADEGADTETVSLPVLATVGGTMSFSDITAATTFSMPVMVEHDGPLTINIDDAGTVDLSAFANNTVASTGLADTTPDALSTTAGTLTAPAFVMGEITANNLTSVSLPLWEGTAASSFDKATTVVLPKITARGGNLDIDINGIFPRATSVHIVGNSHTSSASTPVTSEVEISGGSATRLETIILDGVFSTVTLSGNTSLVTLDVEITAEDFVLTGSDVVDAIVDITPAAASTTGETSVTVTNNLKLESITFNNVDALNELTITGNSDLAVASFPDLTASSGDEPNTLIQNNKFAATTTETAGTTASTYATTSNSGIVELKEYLTDVIANRAGDVRMIVEIDELTSIDDEGASSGPTATDIINLLDATTTGGDDAVAYQLAVQLDPNGSDTVQVTIDGDNLFVNSSGTAAAVTPSDNMALAVTELKSASAVSRAAALGVNYDVVSGGAPAALTVSFTAALNSATGETTLATTSATAMASDDYAQITITNGSTVNTVTSTIGSYTGTATSTVGIASALASAWSTKYGSASSLFSLEADTASGVISITVNAGSGNRAHGSTVAVTYNTGTDTSTTPLLDFVIGASNSTADNVMLGESVILLFQNDTEGESTPLNDIVVITAATSDTLTSTLDNDVDSTILGDDAAAGNVFPTEGRGLAIPAWDGTDLVTTDAGSAVNLLARF